MLWELIILITVLVLLVVSISRWRVHPFFALLLSALTLGLLLGLSGVQTVEVVLEGFSNTLKWIAIVVILGAFIGEVLRETGGALRISNAVVKRTGKEKLPWAMGITGYLISIPVFVDVAYIVLQPVTEALSARTRKPIMVLGLALTAGLTVSHTLIPPTPGPLALASYLKADIGRMLLINGFVGICAMAGGILWASHFCKNLYLPYDEKLKENQINQAKDTRDQSRGHVLLDLLPILVPILLMSVGAFYRTGAQTILYQVISFISIPMIAVLIGAAIAWIRHFQLRSPSKINQLVEQAIVKSALVIMITGAGGAFGYVIRESGFQDSLTIFFSEVPLLGFLFPFLLAAAFTTATGSITVSLIGAGTLLGPIAASMNYSPEIMAALIGSGSFCVFHANSSFFWLLNRLHEVPVSVLYKTYTLQSLIMGISGLIGVMILRTLGVS